MLTKGEMEHVRKMLGREPSEVELGMCEIMFSEHASYKTSRPHLKNLPTKGEQVVVGPGYDAGVVDIGGGWCAAFRIESHNHPSAIEPFNGAATGVGGIIRDVLAMGARPVALLDSLHFGSLKSAHSRWLFRYVVKGVGSYGNCIGVPTVAGEVQFDSSFERNCLVTVACVGFVKREGVFQSKAENEGDILLLVGGSTGRDGIHGVTFASRELGKGSEGDRPAVQVGDPFTKKLIMDATLEAFDSGVIKGVRDLGGGGLTCAASEVMGRGNMGGVLDIEKVILREKGMTPYEIMLSESQERMLFIVAPENVEKAEKIFGKYELNCVQVGKIAKGEMVVRMNGKVVARMNPKLLSSVPAIERKAEKPKIERKGGKVSAPIGEALPKLISSENICSKRWVYQQYDHEVGNRTVAKPGEDGGVILAPNGGAIGVKVDGNSEITYIDPYKGGGGLVCECYRNMVAKGMRPIALVDNLNFGNPEKPAIMWQFTECVKGIGDACRALGTPCVGGNVSFYNEDTETGTAVKPTPVIMLLGSAMDRNDIRKGKIKDGESVLLVGMTKNELGGSEYSRVYGVDGGNVPSIDFDSEKKNGEFILGNLKDINGIHDISKGGLAVALAELCIGSMAGMVIDKGKINAEAKEDGQILFSETNGRYIITSNSPETLIKSANERGIPVSIIGKVGGDRLVIGTHKWGVGELKEGYENSLWVAMEGKPEE